MQTKYDINAQDFMIREHAVKCLKYSVHATNPHKIKAEKTVAI